MPIPDPNDPDIAGLLEQYTANFSPPTMEYRGEQLIRPVVLIEHVGRPDAFDFLTAALKIKLLVPGTGVKGLVIECTDGTLGRLVQIDNSLVFYYITEDGHVEMKDDNSDSWYWPDGVPVPSLNDLIAWNFDPALSGGAAALVEQTIYLQKFYCPRETTLSSVMFNVTNAIAFGGSQSYVGLYSLSGTKLAETADINTQFESTGMKTVSFTTPYVANHGYYYTAILAGNNPGLGPQLTTSGSATGLANANLSASTLRFAIGPAGQTSLPSSITMSSNTMAGGVNPWVGLK